MAFYNWHMVYYVFGGVSFLWLLLLKYYALNNDVREAKDVSFVNRKEDRSVPWKIIFSKPAIW